MLKVFKFNREVSFKEKSDFSFLGKEGNLLTAEISPSKFRCIFWLKREKTNIIFFKLEKEDNDFMMT